MFYSTAICRYTFSVPFILLPHTTVGGLLHYMACTKQLSVQNRRIRFTNKNVKYSLVNSCVPTCFAQSKHPLHISVSADCRVAGLFTNHNEVFRRGNVQCSVLPTCGSKQLTASLCVENSSSKAAKPRAASYRRAVSRIQLTKQS